MSPAKLIDALGGATAVARELGDPASTVHSWKRFNRVPRWRQPDLLKMASAKGVAFDGFPCADPAPAVQQPVPIRSSRTVVCAVCDKRLDDRTVRGCQWQDCPQSERWAA